MGTISFSQIILVVLLGVLLFGDISKIKKHISKIIKK